MAWTNPKTFVNGAVLTAADMNTYVSDNTAALRNAAINVQSAAKTDTFTSSSATFVDVDGLSVTITPSSDTSKILVLLDVKGSNTGSSGSNRPLHVQLVRDSTAIYVGAAASNRVQATSFASEGVGGVSQLAGVFLDSPATDSAVTYKVQVRVATSFATNGTATINRSGDDSNNDGLGRTASSITVIEVPA